MKALRLPRIGVAGAPRWVAPALIALWLAVPVVLRDWDYGVHIAIIVALYIILALSLNLVNGQAGQLNLGHAAFFGIGAYTSALLMLLQGWSFWATLPAAIVVTAVFGFLVGLPSLRVGGDYLGIVTLGFGEITRLVLINWMDLTRGPMGLPGIPQPNLFGWEFNGKLPFFYLITVFALFTWFFLKRLTVSRFGLQMLALREDERVASTLGIDTGRIKLAAFAISAGLAGLAGAFYASYVSFISPDTFVLNDSIIMLCMVVLGGMGSMVGSVIGACVLIVAPEALRFLQDWRLVLYGVLLTGMMIYRPSGVWGLERRTRNEIKLSARG